MNREFIPLKKREIIKKEKVKRGIKL